MARDPDAARSVDRHLRSSARSGAASDTRLHAGLAACVVALLACLGLGLAQDPTDGAGDDDRGPVEITTSAVCLPVSGSGAYTSGSILLRNPGAPVQLTGVRLTGAGGLTLDQAYAVPAPDGGSLGSSAQWPPAKEQLQAAPGWLSRVKAVGADRLGPTGTDDAAAWNLVLHLTGSVDAGAGYTSVLVDYRVGGRSWTARSADGMKIRASC